MALPLRDDAPTRRVPWVTLALIAVNVVVFLFVQPPAFQGGGLDGPPSTVDAERFAAKWAAIPCEIQHLEARSEGIECADDPDEAPPPLAEGKVVLLSLLTAMFLHASIDHLAGNMLFLWVFGNNVEDRIGPVPYLLLYLVTGVMATLGHAAFHWDEATPVLGASGAIAGVMGAYLVFRPRNRVLTFVFTPLAIVYLPAWAMLGLFFVTQFLTQSEGVAWIAHAAGMVAGFLIALSLMRLFADPDRPAPPTPSDADVGNRWALPSGPPPAG
jgi:membrane associated rhomboid family serine protease